MIVITRKHSYFITNEDVAMVEAGSMVFDPEESKMYMVLEPGILTETDIEMTNINSADELIAILNNISGGTNLTLNQDIELTAYVPITGEGVVDMNLNNHNIIRNQATALYVNSDNIEVNIKGQGEIAGAQAVWTKAGTTNIYEGTFRSDSSDCIYAAGTGKVNIYGGEFFSVKNEKDFAEPQYVCLNIKDADRKTASITVYGGIFHNFDPANNVSEGEGTNFVAPGYKSVEQSEGIFVVMPE